MSQQRLTAAEYRATQKMPTTQRKQPGKGNAPPKPRASPDEPATPPKRRDADTMARQQAAPTVKALFQVATHEGFDGARLVAVGLTNEQVAALRAAAEAAGVSERQ